MNDDDKIQKMYNEDHPESDEALIGNEFMRKYLPNRKTDDLPAVTLAGRPDPATCFHEWTGKFCKKCGCSFRY